MDWLVRECINDEVHFGEATILDFHVWCLAEGLVPLEIGDDHAEVF